mgnify:CR=1 FL=1
MTKEWSAFLNYTTAALQPHEYCDGMRHNQQRRESATIADRWHLENRYLGVGSVRLTFLPLPHGPQSNPWHLVARGRRPPTDSPPCRHVVAVGAVQHQQCREESAYSATANTCGLWSTL